MKFWGHTFSNFGSCERICWACGYVVDREGGEAEIKRWMRDEEGAEPHCGGRWHYIIRKQIVAREQV